MRDTMVHRGPDDCGIYINSPGALRPMPFAPRTMHYNVGLGHTRLSIIDLSPAGHQPMCNENETIWLTCNGEIYNHKELRSELEKRGHIFKSNSDNEVIIHLYEDYGIEMLKKLDGDFAFGLWDEQHKRLFVVRDRLGIKPCFYYQDSNKLIFASEIKALLQDSSITKEIDPIALHHYLTFLSVPAPWTMYKGINKLLPGHYLLIENNKIKIVDYYCLYKKYNQPLVYKKEEEYIDEFIFLLKKSIKKRLMADVPLGVFLSGGIDSSTIVALMSELTDNIKTFSIIFDHKYSCDESFYSRQISKLFNTEHYEFFAKPEIFNKLPEIINYFDEPFAVTSAVPLFCLSEFANKIIKVALTGDGGDELFAGYVRYYRDKMAGRFNRLGIGPLAKAGACLIGKIPSNILPRKLGKARDLARKLLLSISMEPDKRYLNFFTFLSEEMKYSLYTDIIKKECSNIDSISILQYYYKKVSQKNSLARRTYADIMTTLPDEMLTKGDRMLMAHSIENRVPFLDQKLVEFSSRLPDSFKLRGKIGKYITKRAMHNKLPSQFLYRRKRSFNVPLGYWLRNELKWLISEYLDANKIKQQNIFKVEKVNSLVKKFTGENANLEYELFALIIFQVWFEGYYKK